MGPKIRPKTIFANIYKLYVFFKFKKLKLIEFRNMKFPELETAWEL